MNFKARKTFCFISMPSGLRAQDLDEEKQFYDKYWDVYGRLFGIDFKDIGNAYSLKEPPLWILHLAPIVEEANKTCKIYDLSDYFLDTINDDVIRDIPESDIYAFSPITKNYSFCLKIAKKIRKYHPNSLIVAGGSHVTFYAEDCLRNGFDVIMHGEGEVVMHKLLVEEDVYTSDIQNISFLDQTGNFVTKKADCRVLLPIENIKQPKYELYSSLKYSIGRVYSGRGCPYNCAFCANTIWKKKKPVFKGREFFQQEVDNLVKNLHPKVIFVADETLSYDMDHLRMVCEVMKNSKVPWSCQTRPDQVDDEVLELLRDNGCKLIGLGVESADETVLKAINKGFNLEKLEASCKKIKKYGMGVLTYWLIGLPRETRASVELTQKSAVRLLEEGLTDLVEYFIAVPYPGTDIYENPNKYGIEIDYNYDRFVENAVSCTTIGDLKPEEIFESWKNGLVVFADSMKI